MRRTRGDSGRFFFFGGAELLDATECPGAVAGFFTAEDFADEDLVEDFGETCGDFAAGA